MVALRTAPANDDENHHNNKPYEVPFFSFGGDQVLAGGERWRELCDKVREACETHGCFCVSTDTIPAKLREGMVEGLRQLFDLPAEVKERHVNPKPYRSYFGKNAAVPHLESFGIDHAAVVEGAQAFTQLMWPHGGNPSFCEAMNEMSIKMLELNLFLMEKERFSWGSFLMPKDDSTVEVAQGLVDKEHPLMYRPFTFAEFISYCVSKVTGDALEIYAGVD